MTCHALSARVSTTRRATHRRLARMTVVGNVIAPGNVAVITGGAGGIGLAVAEQLIERGMRIAQMIIAPIVQAVPHIVEQLSQTERGAGGFGSTGTDAGKTPS